MPLCVVFSSFLCLTLVWKFSYCFEEILCLLFDSPSNPFLEKRFCLLRVILLVWLEFTLQDYLNNASVCWSNFASLVRVYITVLPELIIIVAVAASSDSVLISNRKMSWHWHIYDLICVCFKYFLRHVVTDEFLFWQLFSLYSIT